MIERTTRWIFGLTLTALLCVLSFAQTPSGAGGRYEQDGLSFTYPDGWTLTDKSNPQAQHLILTRTGGVALIMVVAYREPVASPEQLMAAHNNVLKSYAEGFAREFGIEKGIDWRGPHCQQVGERSATGFKIDGRYKGQPSTGEVYAVMLGHRLVSVVYVRHDADDAQAAPAWKAVLDTLKVEVPADAPPLAEALKGVITGGVLEGKALRKPQPEYPSTARSARASGVVTVQIVVNENGDVTSANAISGHPLLRESAVRAALKAKFSPTKLCGEPVKVSGVITYAYVLH